MTTNDLCDWGDLPRARCPHCQGELTGTELICKHGNNAFGCFRCAVLNDRQITLVLPEWDFYRYAARLGDKMRMQALREHNGEYDVVLGLCPGCESWQIDYTDAVAASFVDFVREPAEDGATFSVDPSGFHAVIEEALQEHAAECVHLQRLLKR